MNTCLLRDPQFGVNTYCLLENGHALLIDPIVCDALTEVLAGAVVDFALLTHEHYDHICGVNDLREKLGIPVLCGEKAAVGLADPTINMSRYIDFLKTVLPFGCSDVEPLDYVCHADATLTDGQMLYWKGHDILIRETPGHSAGSIAILVDDQLLFSGDTIFKEYPTATRLPGGSSKAFARITEPWLNALLQEMTVYPGHTEPFLLKERYHT